jgi:hypothetical protein
MKAGCVPIGNGHLNRSRRFDAVNGLRRFCVGQSLTAIRRLKSIRPAASLHPVACQLVGNFGLDRLRRHDILFASGGISLSLLG